MARARANDNERRFSKESHNFLRHIYIILQSHTDQFLLPFPPESPPVCCLTPPTPHHFISVNKHTLFSFAHSYAVTLLDFVSHPHIGLHLILFPLQLVWCVRANERVFSLDRSCHIGLLSSIQLENVCIIWHAISSKIPHDNYVMRPQSKRLPVESMIMLKHTPPIQTDAAQKLASSLPGHQTSDLRHHARQRQLSLDKTTASLASSFFVQQCWHYG